MTLIKREYILKNLNVETKINGHIIGVATGSGITAKYAENGGADFILALNSGKFRQMGRGSLAGMLPFFNSNDMVMDFASREILPLVKRTPVIFGFNATDPTKNMKEYIGFIKKQGFSGINNFPTIGIIDGEFRKSLEEDGCCYDLEVEAIGIAHEMGLFTIAFVFDEDTAKKMINVGADVICVHLGLTQGGMLGAKKILSLESARERVEKILKVCNEINPNVIKLIYGGPVKTPIDVQYMYSNNKLVMGYIGGSAFERIPSEKSIINITKAFKTSGNLSEDDLMIKMLDGITKHYDYVEFVKEYVAKNYMNDISFLDLAKVAHISRSHLSNLFKKDVGCSFPQYLVKYRIDKSIAIMNREKIPLTQLAYLVGYNDYSQFSRMFKKYKRCSPTQYFSDNKKNL